MLIVWDEHGNKYEVAFEWHGREVVCGVHGPGDEHRIGIARTSEKDVFVKETGRKIALGRALRCPLVTSGTLDRDTRTLIWGAYRATKKYGTPFWSRYDPNDDTFELVSFTRGGKPCKPASSTSTPL